MRGSWLYFIAFASLLSVVIAKVFGEERLGGEDLVVEEGVTNSYGAFIGAFTTTFVAEFGDTTFIITAILSSKYGRGWVVLGCLGSLLVMSFLSCSIGEISENFVSRLTLKYLSSGLFFYFGGKALYEVITNTVEDDDEEIAERLEKIFSDKSNKGMTTADKSKTKKKVELREMTGVAVAVQTFTQTFLGEWGDSSQISTVALSASFSFWDVFFGSTLAQIICCLLAALGGKILAKNFSEKTMTCLGGIFFILSGVATILAALQ